VRPAAIRPRPAASPPAWAGGAIILLLAGAPLAARILAYPYLLAIADRAAIMGGAAISLQFLIGGAGLISLGHAAFLGIGGYAAIACAAWGVNEAALSLPLALLGATAFALGTGSAALRTRGITFIMITLAFAQMAYFIAQSLAVFGGDDGMPLDPPRLLGSSALQTPLGQHVLALLTLALLLAAFRVVTGSRYGRVLRAARESEARVVAAGYSVRHVRLIAYALAGGAAGISGWLLSVHAGFVSPAMMEWRVSGELLVMAILVGSREPEGAILGAVSVVAAEEVLSATTEHWRLIFCPLVIGFALWRARGWSAMRA
jgi:branched-chain amino acid transport system permease protein